MNNFPDRDVFVGPNPAGTPGASRRLILLSLHHGPDLEISLALSPLEAEHAITALNNRLEALYRREAD